MLNLANGTPNFILDMKDDISYQITFLLMIYLLKVDVCLIQHYIFQYFLSVRDIFSQGTAKKLLLSKKTFMIT